MPSFHEPNKVWPATQAVRDHRDFSARWPLVSNIDVSRYGQSWERKYRFETVKSFQYPTLHEHAGTLWLAVTQGATDEGLKERIMFGKLE